MVATSCGNKDESSGSSLASDPYKLQSAKGTVDFNNQQGQYFQKDGVQYKIMDTSGAMGRAYSLAQQNGVFIQTQSVYKVTIQGYFSKGQQPVQQQPGSAGYNGMPMGTPYVNVSSAVFSR